MTGGKPKRNVMDGEEVHVGGVVGADVGIGVGDELGRMQRGESRLGYGGR